MRSPFFVIRFVFFSLLVYLNLGALIFAAWNIGASHAAGVYVLGSSIFLIFNSIMLFILVALALSELALPKISTAMVAFECGWTGVMAILALAASIDATLSGPPALCQSKAPFSLCASSTILIPISWLTGTLMLAYFLTLFGLVVSQMHTVDGIWHMSVYNVPWFTIEHVKSDAPQLPPIRTSILPRLSLHSRRYSTSSIPQDVEAQPQTSISSEKPLPTLRHEKSRSQNVETTRPWWARQFRLRPGKDDPFAGPSKGKGKGRPNGGPRSPVSPPSDYTGSILYPEREVRRPGQPPLPPYPQFTKEMFDPDKPIPLPRLSQWVRADEARGIDVHTIPLPNNPYIRDRF